MSQQESPAVATSLILVVLVVAAGAGVYYFAQKAEPPAAEELLFTEVPGQLPEDWAVADLDGKELTMREFHGKVLFLNHWATWCGPCVQEMPSIQALYESMRNTDVAFVILSEEPPEKVKSFVQKRQWSLPIYVAVEGLPPVLRSQFIPATFLINRKGQVFRKEGGMDWNSDAVRTLLKKVS